MLVEIGAEVLGEGLLHRRLHLARHELFLRLGRELGVWHLHGHHRGKTFAGIVTRGRHRRLLRQPFPLDVLIEGAGEAGAETRQVGATIPLRHVVGVGEHLLLVAVVPLHGHFHANLVIPLFGEMEERVEGRLVHVEELDEGAQAAFVAEPIFLAGAFVLEADGDAVVQERELPEALGQHVVMELDVAENVRRGLEEALGALALGLAHRRERRIGHPGAVGLLIDAAIAPHGEPKLLRKRVHHGNAHPVQAAGHLVAVVVELTAGVQRGHDDLGGGHPLLGMNVHRNAAAVVRHRDGFARVQDDVDFVAVAGQGFIDGVIDQLLHHVVQPRAVLGVADVHARPLAHGIQAAQHLDAAGVVGFLGHAAPFRFRASAVPVYAPCTTPCFT